MQRAIAVVATMRIKEADVVRFKELISRVITNVRSNEESTLQYALFECENKHNEYVLLEQFVNADAWEAHKRNPVLLQLKPELYECFENSDATVLSEVHL